MKTKAFIIISILAVVVFSSIFLILAYDQEIKVATGLIAKDDNSKSYRTIEDPLCFSMSNNTSAELCIPLNTLAEHGCSKPILEHLAKYSNLINYEWQEMFWRDWISLPKGISEKQFDECVEFLQNQRTGNTETKTEISNEPTVHSLPFGLTQKEIKLQLHVDPIYIKNPNNPKELILDVDSMMQVQKILDKCDYKQKLESGEISAKNPDGSFNAITGSLRFYNNGTHYIDSNTCKWIDSFEVVTYNCFEAKPTEQNWHYGPDYFDNGTPALMCKPVNG